VESYWESVFAQASVVIIVALGLNLQIGYAGIYLAAPAALFGVGAYAAALVSLHLTSSLLLVVLASIAVSVVVAALFGVVAARIRGEYFIIASLALGFVVTGLSNQLSVLGGTEGLVGIPLATLFGHQLVGNQTFAELGLVAVAIAVVVFALLVNSTIGRRWRAVMNDEFAARSLGLRPTWLRIGASATSGVFFGVAGALYAANIQFVGAADFGANESFLLIVAVVVGGAGTVWGPVLGGLIVSAISGGLALINFPPSYAGIIPEIAYGVILVTILIGAPSGLMRLRFGLGRGGRDDRRRSASASTVEGRA
jgi:branched-chain amino acid transport system permease protein